MYLKTLPQMTVTDLMEQIETPTRTFTVPTSSIRVAYNHQTDDAIHVGDAEYPYTSAGVVALGDWLEIPSKFLTRLDEAHPDLLTSVVNTLLSRKQEDVSVSVGDSGLVDAAPPNGRRIDPRSVVEIAARVISPDAQVVAWERSNQNYHFEVITRPEQAEVDNLQVNDISHGGLRFGQESKENLAPWVQPYIYRLICTNGMEIPDDTLKISSKGNTVEEVIESLEEMAEIAFARVDADIAAFYQMRNDVVNHPAMVLTRMGGEQGLSDTRLRNILEALPEYLDESGRCTQFDLVNVITNEANNPTLANRFNASRNLQRSGGQIAFEHASRCHLCQSKIG